MSGDIMAGFKQYSAARPSSGTLDMNVLVLTSGFWPSYRTFDCLLPTELLRAQQVRRRSAVWSCLLLFFNDTSAATPRWGAAVRSGGLACCPLV